MYMHWGHRNIQYFRDNNMVTAYSWACPAIQLAYKNKN